MPAGGAPLAAPDATAPREIRSRSRSLQLAHDRARRRRHRHIGLVPRHIAARAAQISCGIGRRGARK
jgi:hypothetical protein